MPNEKCHRQGSYPRYNSCVFIGFQTGSDSRFALDYVALDVKRQMTAALQDAQYIRSPPYRAKASWTAPALWRFG
jgi:hypothetical protein